jgi:hypothetical protein
MVEKIKGLSKNSQNLLRSHMADGRENQRCHQPYVTLADFGYSFKVL